MLHKISIKIESILQLTALAMIIFSLIGFFYVKIFYGSFGIEVSNYFVLSDYLSVSVTKIYTIILSLLLLVLVIFISNFLYKKDIENGIDFESNSFRIYDKITSLIYIIIMLNFTIHSYLKKDGYFFIYLFLLLFLFLSEVVLFFGKKYVIKKIYIITIIFLVGFVFIFYGATKSDAEILKKSTNSHAVVNLENQKVNHYLFLGANSSFVFLYDKNQSKSYIFPKDKLEYIEIKN